jgi:glucose-1-phosphate adenylyltransferase
MLRRKKTVAMLLAGGQGSRLGALTTHRAKPGVAYGGKYRIIDFPLSNCIHSGIDTVGVLTQYEPLELNTYIGTGGAWDMDTLTGGVYVLPPFLTSEGGAGSWYSGTADAIFQNSYFIEQFNPKNLLVLSGDHIYKMNYAKMISEHIANKADATIAVMPVPKKETSRFGIMTTDSSGGITEFYEKPKEPKSNLASMGIYVFEWEKIKKYLKEDSKDKKSDNDFGKNIIPKMLAGGERMHAYEYRGFWRDVGTVDSLWEANMELLSPRPRLGLYDTPWKILSKNPNEPPQYIGEGAKVSGSIISEGCIIDGQVARSILSPGVKIERGARVADSIVMQNTVIREGAKVDYSIIDENVKIGKAAKIGAPRPAGKKDAKRPAITVVGGKARVEAGAVVREGEMIAVKEEVRAEVRSR